MAADANAVGKANTNIRNDIAHKIDIAKDIGYTVQASTVECDLANFQNGSYLLIAPRSSLVSAFFKESGNVICFDSNVEASGEKITVKNLQWYTTVYVIKIQ